MIPILKLLVFETEDLFLQVFKTRLYLASASCTGFIEGVYSTDYQNFVEIIDRMSYLKEKLALDKISHFITFQKFVPRVPISLSNLLLSRILKLFYSYEGNVSIAAIDATGFTSYMQVIIIPEEPGNFEETSWELQYQ